MLSFSQTGEGEDEAVSGTDTIELTSNETPQEAPPAQEPQEEAPPAPPEAEESKAKPAKKAKQKKPGLFAMLKNLGKYKVQVGKKEGDDEGDMVDPAQEGQGKKAKKPKAKKAPKKKAKPVKAKPKPQPKAKGKDAKAGPSKKLILIIVAVVVLAGGGTAAFLVFGADNSPEAKLEKALQYTEEEKYEKSIDIYNKLIEDEEVLVDAYLGLANTLVAMDDTEGAVAKLTIGYETTEDPDIKRQLDELTPAPTPDPNLPVIPSSEPIQWGDPAFESLVRVALGKPSGDISEADLAGVTTLKILGDSHATTASDGLKSINGVDSYTLDGQTYSAKGTITNLDDIVHFTNLKRLTIGYNSLEDISGVSQLHKLSMLGLYGNDIGDLSALMGLSQLKGLHLYNNNISDLSPLRHLTSLEELSLQHNSISDLSPIAGLVELRELYISYNSVSDLTPLANMQKLVFLNAQHNSISDISPVAKLQSLTDANFVGNRVVDYTPASHVQNLNSSFGIVKGS